MEKELFKELKMENTVNYVMVFKDKESYEKFSKEIKNINPESNRIDDDKLKNGYIGYYTGINVYIDEDFYNLNYQFFGEYHLVFVREEFYLEYLKGKEKRDEEN